MFTYRVERVRLGRLLGHPTLREVPQRILLLSQGLRKLV